VGLKRNSQSVQVQEMNIETRAPALEFVLELRVTISPTVEIGLGAFGSRRMVPITGGSFSGVLSGRVLPGGADWQFVEGRRVSFLDAHYVIEAEDGTRIEVRNRGIRHGPQSVIDRLSAGEQVPATNYYFRTSPRFYPPDGKHEWLKQFVFVGSCERFPDLVVVKVWKVL
jgi:hypothetical protein